jgi:hypothetical protein
MSPRREPKGRENIEVLTETGMVTVDTLDEAWAVADARGMRRREVAP